MVNSFAAINGSVVETGSTDAILGHPLRALVIAVVFGLVFPMQVYVGPAMAGFPAWLRSPVIVIIQVLLMTYLVMPRVTALLKPWLFSNR